MFKLSSKKSCKLICLSVSLFSIIIFPLSKSIAQSKKPNIIFILGDDIGYNTLTINGGRSYSTLNLDLMAKQGMNFTQCHAAPMCSPSRFMLFTGKYNFRNYTQWGVMDKSQKTIAKLLNDNGYKTACFGKWQLSGGFKSIQAFGFDSYCVCLPFESSSDDKYKNPAIYTNSANVPDSLVKNKYGEDIFCDSALDFMSRNKSNPFFIYYPMALAHLPFQPTPDDPEFDSWTSATASDTSYYPSMIKYMDKKIGLILKKVKSLGIEDNTIIIYTGDNGSPTEISEQTDDGGIINGGKSTTTEFGTHVPLIVYWPGKISEGSVNTDLIGFTDFFTTIADLANIKIPASYSPLDGVSFAQRLYNNRGNPRSSLFYHFDPFPQHKDTLTRWAQTGIYKLYDTSSLNKTRLFYNIKADINEKKPLANESLSSDQINIRQQLLEVINGYVHEGTPILGDPYLSGITSSSAMLQDTLEIDGGSTIKSDGTVWDTHSDPMYPASPNTLNKTPADTYQGEIKGLNSNSIYYARVYAKNIAGIAYSSEIKFKTLLNSPRAIPATLISGNKFTANWHSVNAASGYKLYVSTKPDFTIKNQYIVNEGFEKGIIPPIGWTFSGSIGVNDTIHGELSPAIQFKASKAKVVTRQLSGPALQLKFWIKGLDIDAASYLRVEGFNGAKWVIIKDIQPIPSNGVTKTFDSSTNDQLPVNITQFRFTYFKSKGTLAFDNVNIKYNTISNSFIKGYNGLNVNDTSSIVTGLQTNTNYYYRIKASGADNISDNSNTVLLATCTVPFCGNQIPTRKLNIDESIEQSKEANVNVFPNPTTKEFVLSFKSNNGKSVELIVTDVYGKTVYRGKSIDNDHFVFGKTFIAGNYFAQVMKDGSIKTLKLVKQ